MSQKQILSPEQDKAANPSENVWVQANAGTGKTSVLVQRLMRILFRAGGDAGILCLTYTNAAAGEMRNRILKMLRRWAMASDKELADMLIGITSNTKPTGDDLAHARDIFFKYIDNPEILKIKTIHGFCEEILRRFPIEAGINPTWALISGPNQKILLQETFDRLIKTSTQDAAVSNAFARIIERISEYSLPELLDKLTGQYKVFFQVDDIVKYRKYFIDTIKDFLNLNTPINLDIDHKKLEKIIELAQEEIKSSKKPAQYLINIVNTTRQYIDTNDNFTEYQQLYLKKDCGKIKKISEKEYLCEEQERVYSIVQRRINQEIFDDTVAMFDLAAAFANSYKTLKQSHNVLDFDDLILYTQKLFSRPDTMGWVLSQLDLSLNHILVDEAQDTSPQQWSILRMMAGDFFADGDTVDNPHSIFVVGDTKQSIYGFQGADPNAFASSRDEIKSQISNNLRTICEIPLAQSFRSTKPILDTVDKFFENPEIATLANFHNNTHKCFRIDAPGLVEIHPLVSKKESECDIKQ
ncbi:UvrD-helicase domain-containing protein, partial [bacterium]|nr:UvrD-helicase domain-containing protein [bacterium]